MNENENTNNQYYSEFPPRNIQECYRHDLENEANLRHENHVTSMILRREREGNELERLNQENTRLYEENTRLQQENLRLYQENAFLSQVLDENYRLKMQLAVYNTMNNLIQNQNQVENQQSFHNQNQHENEQSFHNQNQNENEQNFHHQGQIENQESFQNQINENRPSFNEPTTSFNDQIKKRKRFEKVRPKKPKRFKCRYCKMIFDQFDLLDKHRQENHKDEITNNNEVKPSQDSPEPISAPAPAPANQKEKHVICKKCNRTFVSKYSLHQHIQSNKACYLGRVLISCAVCQLKFKNRKDLNNHMVKTNHFINTKNKV